MMPAWAADALAQTPESGSVDVDGCAIHHLAWGDPSAPTLMLVHGGAAHAHWWSPIAPLLASTHRVVALDLSGHGDSGRRATYRAEQWAEEILGVAAAAGGPGRPVVVGHSMGGFVTFVTAANHGARLEGAIVLDAPVRRADPESEEGRAGRLFAAPRSYPTFEEAVEHFFLVPPQPSDNSWYVDHIARTSLRESDDGWTWKFDPGMFTRREGARTPSDFAPQLARAAARLAIITGERSAIVDDDSVAYMSELLAGSPAAAAGIPFVPVPEAQHHLFVDQPLAVVAAIRGVLATWNPVGTPPRPVAVPEAP